MSTPEKKCAVRGGGLGSCDNLSGGAADMDRSLRFLEKHKVVLLGINYLHEHYEQSWIFEKYCKH